MSQNGSDNLKYEDFSKARAHACKVFQQKINFKDMHEQLLNKQKKQGGRCNSSKNNPKERKRGGV